MTSKAEELPVEIWLFLFTYFEAHDLVQAFANLNSSFDSLLASPQLQLHVRIRQHECNERLPSFIWSHINLENIFSLSVKRRRGKCLIQFLRWHAPRLSRLRGMSLYLKGSNSYNNLQFVAFALQQIPSLTHIRLQFRSHSFQPGALNMLMTAILNDDSRIRACSFFKWPLTNNQISLLGCSFNFKLKWLHVDDISWNDLLMILSRTPCLRSLHAMTSAFRDFPIRPIELDLSCLKIIDLRLSSNSSNQLQKLKNISPHLRCF